MSDKIGRPLKEPPAKAVKIISDVASRGGAEISIAYALGTSFKTWQRWREDYPELKEAYDQARAKEHDTLVNILFEKAKKGDSVAAMFLLKCRHNYRDGGITIEDMRILHSLTSYAQTFAVLRACLSDK